MSCSEETIIIRFGLSNNLFIPMDFFAENYLFSHTIIFVKETNETCCFEKGKKNYTENTGDKILPYIKLSNYNLKLSLFSKDYTDAWSEAISLIQNNNILDFYYSIKK